jgi:hypothetical protein
MRVAGAFTLGLLEASTPSVVVVIIPKGIEPISPPKAAHYPNAKELVLL